MRPFLVLVSMLILGSGLFAQPQNLAAASQNPAAPQSLAPPAPSAAPSSGDAACLHVYRQRRYAGSALAPSIYVDDTQIARVGNGRRVSIRLTPGPHTIRSDDKSSAISLEVKVGQDYFVRIDEETGFWKGHGRLTLVLPEQGTAEYKLQKPIEEERKIVKEMICDEPKDAASAAKN
jgi:hypothetical protein